MAHCISNDLVCDNINHCPDGTDEATTPTCQGTVNNSIYVIRIPMLNLTRANEEKKKKNNVVAFYLFFISPPSTHDDVDGSSEFNNTRESYSSENELNYHGHARTRK